MPETVPTTMNALFELYYQECKPLYSEVSANNQMPPELLFEINAAFDHVSRIWKYGEDEAAVCAKASAHLKRACFDAFKLILKRHVDDLERLLAINTGIIDNGNFDKALFKLKSQLLSAATDARSSEGESRESWHDAFSKWREVHRLCKRLNAEFILNPNVDWAKKLETRTRTWINWPNIIAGFIVGVLGSLLAAYLYDQGQTILAFLESTFWE